MVAAMTGLRQGELVALRWRDIDWATGVVRVRRNYSRGEWGTPKSRRSNRAVPMADRAAAELERHFQRSAYRADDQLVFCHPHTGNPYDASKLRERFYRAMLAAGMGERCGREGGITFHSLRHTFGTRMAAVGVPMRTLQEWMATVTSQPRLSTPTSHQIRRAARRLPRARSAHRCRRLSLVRPQNRAQPLPIDHCKILAEKC